MKFNRGFPAVLLLLAGWVPQEPSPLEKYRRLEFPPKAENFDKGWQDRVAVEFEIINTSDLKSLRAGLKDPDFFVRAMAARALGIRADKTSAEALAELAKADPEYLVRMRAVESLGFLKMKSEVIEEAKKDPNVLVWYAARMAAGQLERDTDFASQVREAYATGIKREVMGSAKVGKPAPDFSARTSDGKVFKLSDVLGKKPVVIYFAAFDT